MDVTPDGDHLVFINRNGTLYLFRLEELSTD